MLMKISQRVRAILITKNNQLVLLKRTKPGFAPHWIAPGGVLVDSGADLEAVLVRDMREAIGGAISVVKPVFFLEHILEEEVVIQQWFYLCYLLDGEPLHYHPTASGAASGARALPDGNWGEVKIETFALKREALKGLNIQPEKLKGFLLNYCDQLMALPALRV